MPDTHHRLHKIHKSGEPHRRSLQHRNLFVIAVLWTSIHFICLLGTITAFVAFFFYPTKQATYVIVASLILSSLSWLIAFFRRRAAHCPLCKGTPLINSGALTHQKAVRFRPLNHGVSAILSIIATLNFRCMYCGSPFDMLKSPTRLRHAGDGVTPQETTTGLENPVTIDEKS